MTRSSRVSAKGSIVIPKNLREKYGLKPGTLVQIVDYARGLSIVPVSSDPIVALSGMFEDRGGRSLTEDLIEERRREREREDRLLGR